MAKPQNKTHPTNSCFLGCFGFSSIKTPPEKTSHPGAKSKRSWPKFSLSLRKSRHKTVPVDTHPDKASEAADGKSHTSKLIKKKSDTKVISSKPQSTTPVSNYKPSRQSSKAHEQSVAIPSNQAAAREKPKETRLQQGPDQQQNIIIGNRKLSAPTRTSSLTGSPIAKPKPKTNATTKLSHTVSLPAAGGNKRVGNPRIHARTNIKELPRNNNEVVEKLDPLIGMSIIIVTLIIMIVWGRLCAILCTSAWFYFCPRVLRTSINSNNITVTKTATSNDLDLNSEEYKKKVVLEGLLERNHHRLTI